MGNKLSVNGKDPITMSDNVEPLSYMSSELNVLREDKVEQVLTQEQALQNAPVNDTDYIRIPKVIDAK